MIGQKEPREEWHRLLFRQIDRGRTLNAPWQVHKTPPLRSIFVRGMVTNLNQTNDVWMRRLVAIVLPFFRSLQTSSSVLGLVLKAIPPDRWAACQRWRIRQPGISWRPGGQSYIFGKMLTVVNILLELYVRVSESFGAHLLDCFLMSCARSRAQRNWENVQITQAFAQSWIWNQLLPWISRLSNTGPLFSPHWIHPRVSRYSFWFFVVITLIFSAALDIGARPEAIYLL